MVCPNCQSGNEQGAKFCAHCGASLPEQPSQQPTYQQQQGYQQPYYGGASQQPPMKDYLVGNIILAVLSLCCTYFVGTITGIIGIVFSSMVRSRQRMGDMAGALSAQKVAKVMFWVTLGLTIAGLILNIILTFVVSTGVLYEIMEYGLYYY